MDWNVLVTLSAVVLSVHSDGNESRLQCSDWQGKFVSDGTKFFPSNDFCYECTCLGGYPTMCTSVQCSPPDCSLYETVEGACCTFHCIEVPIHGDIKNKSAYIPNYPGRGVDEDTANLGLRLVASTVTSFLILALLLFMVHRLRQRRMLIMMRRLNAERAEDDNVAYMAQFDQLDMGLDFTPYDDPPPPYSPPKPPRVPIGEAPPPYEEALQSPGNNNIGETAREASGETSPPSTRENGRVNRSDDTIEATMPHDEATAPRSSRRSSQTGGAVDESADADVRCPDYMDAVVTDESPDGSQMVVRMHNNIPRASLIDSPRTVEPDSQTSSNVTSPTRTQFVPQSVGTDVVRSTISPRETPHKRKDNSMGRRVGQDPSEHGQNSNRRRSSQHNSPESDDDVHPAIHVPEGRRRDNAGCHGNNSHGNGRASNRRSLGVQVFSVREIKDAAKSLRSRHSLPPTDLELSDQRLADKSADGGPTCGGVVQLRALRKTGRGYPSEGACGGTDVCPHQPPVSSSGLWSTPSGASCPGGGAANQPVVISPSPESPVRQSPVFVRSSSITSEFSICSETGERRQYGAPSVGRSMPFTGGRNHGTHPETRCESNNPPERHPDGSQSRSDLSLRQECPEDISEDIRLDPRRTMPPSGHDSNNETDPRINQRARLDDCASKEPRSHESNSGSHDCGMVRSKVTAAAQAAKITPLTRLIYRDSFCPGDDTDSGNAASVSSLPTCHSVGGDDITTAVVPRSPLRVSPSCSADANRHVKRLSSGTVCLPRVVSETSPDHGFLHEKTTLRQLKKKKRRPHSTPGHPVDLGRTTNDVDNALLHDKNRNVAASPGKCGSHRRTTKDQLDNSATYKEYGFIDTPESSMIHLANADLPESVSRYLAMCKSQQGDDIMNVDGLRCNGTKHSRENSQERNQKKRDGSGSRQKKRRSRPFSAFDTVDTGGDVSMTRHDDVSCSPTRHKHNARHYQN